MEYIKQEVEYWSDDEIFDHLVEVAPGDEAYVKSHSLDSTEALQKMAPLSHRPADTAVHYPHPVVFVDTGQWEQADIETLDIYDVLCEYASREGGCLKFIDEHTGRDYMQESDIIVCADEASTDRYERYSVLNDHRAVETVSAREVMDEILTEIGGEK